MFDEPRDALYLLQRWYSLQADGEWEHDFGVDIGTLDNPGWTLTVELARTPLANVKLEPTELQRSPHDWLSYRIEGQRFQAACGPTNLNEAILAFLDFAGMRGDQTADPPPTKDDSPVAPSKDPAERRARIRELQRQAAARRDPPGWAATLSERLGSTVDADQIADLQTTDTALALLAARAPRQPGVNAWTPQQVRRVVTRDRDVAIAEWERAVAAVATSEVWLFTDDANRFGIARLELRHCDERLVDASADGEWDFVIFDADALRVARLCCDTISGHEPPIWAIEGSIMHQQYPS